MEFSRLPSFLFSFTNSPTLDPGAGCTDSVSFGTTSSTGAFFGKGLETRTDPGQPCPRDRGEENPPGWGRRGGECERETPRRRWGGRGYVDRTEVPVNTGTFGVSPFDPTPTVGIPVSV